MIQHKFKFSTAIILGTLFFLLASCSDDKSKKKTNKAKSQTPTTEPNEDHTAAAENAESELYVVGMDAPQIAKAEDLIGAYSEEVLAGIDAQKLFKINCALCHGFKGDANINGAKDLTKSKVSMAESVAQVYFGKGLMNAYQGVLKDAEIVAVCKYAETLRE